MAAASQPRALRQLKAREGMTPCVGRGAQFEPQPRKQQQRLARAALREPLSSVAHRRFHCGAQRLLRVAECRRVLSE